MTQEEIEKFENQLERLEYSDVQGCFHTTDPTDVDLSAGHDDFSFLGIVKEKEAAEFIEMMFTIAGVPIKTLTTNEMELLLGIYFTDKNQVEKWYRALIETKKKLSIA